MKGPAVSEGGGVAPAYLPVFVGVLRLPCTQERVPLLLTLFKQDMTQVQFRVSD